MASGWGASSPNNQHAGWGNSEPTSGAWGLSPSTSQGNTSNTATDHWSNSPEPNFIRQEVVHSLFPQKEGNVICLKSTPLATEKKEHMYLFYVDKAVLSKKSPVFDGMLTIGSEDASEPEAVQLAEDATTIKHLLSSILDDGQNMPDLFTICSDSLIRLYTAAYKYDIAQVQNLYEYNIRFRLRPESNDIADKGNLSTLLRHACNFDRLALLRDAAAAVARNTRSTNDPFFTQMIDSVDSKGVRLLLEEYGRRECKELHNLRLQLSVWMAQIRDHDRQCPMKEPRGHPIEGGMKKMLDKVEMGFVDENSK